ncbi:MAG: Cell wall/surface repeat protein, partial [Candidatus Nomurabacteria bacterium GW2011_GWB1_43_7]
SGGSGLGSFTAGPFTSLAASTTYHLRAYATNSEGTSYGADVTFTTLAQMTGTLSATNCTVAEGSMGCYTTLTWDTQYPITTSAVTTPTNITVATGNSNTDTAANPDTYRVDFGSRTFYLYNNGQLLAQATATASCASGTEWNGSQCTAFAVPTVISPTVSSITTTSATLGANVTDLGYPTSISARGTCWGTTASPTTNCLAEGGTTTGVFSHSRTGLSPGIFYYYRGYATNSTGTGYSADGTFTTLSTYTLTINTAGTGSGTTTGAGTYNSGVVVALGNTPGANSFFADWSGDVDCSDSSVTMNASKTCTATFTAVTVSVSATTPYTKNPSTNVSFAYTPTTNTGTTECRLLDNISSPLTVYQASSPIVYSSASAAGTYAYYVQCRNTTYTTVTATSNQIIVNVNAAPTANAGVDKSITLPTSSVSVTGTATDSDGTIASTSWSKVSGPSTYSISSPSSLTTNITGLTTAGTYVFRLTATDNGGLTDTDDMQVVVNVSPADIPTVTTAAASNITSSSVTSGGNVTSDGGATVSARGIVIDSNTNPDLTNNSTSNGTGIGSFVSNYSPLTSNKTYYIKAYATNSVGTAYGNEVVFTTLPSITTASITNVTTSGFTSGGTVAVGGGASVTARGVTIDSNQNPDLSNNHTTDGSGTGSFVSNMVQTLQPSTTYYVRAYATNSGGTAFGNQQTFTTPAKPTVTTNSSCTSITSNSMTNGGNVTSNGGATVTVSGIAWNTTGNPTTSNNKTTDGWAIGGPWYSTMTGLSTSITYHIRAYATNSMGTSYGSDVTCTTLAGPMSGTLSPATSACTIASGASSCSINLNWSITNPQATPTAITANGMTNVNVTNTLTTPQSGTQSLTVPYSSRIFYLYNNAIELDSATATSSCITGSTWNGSACALNFYTVTPSAGAGGTISPSTPQSVNYGSTTTFTITPNAGYSISVPVGGTCGGTLAGNTYTTAAITANCTVVASFTIGTNILTVSKSGTGSGIVASSPVGINCGATCSYAFDYGTLVTLTPTPDTGSSFSSWSGDADCTDGSVTMNASQSCAATFALNSYTVSTSATSGGAVTPSSRIGIPYGSTTTFTITPNAGYTALASGCNGSPTYPESAAYIYTTGAIAGNCTVSVIFTSGTLTANPTSCTITSGQNSCNVDLSWTVINRPPAKDGTWMYGTGMSTVNLGVNANSGTQSFSVPYNSRTFTLTIGERISPQVLVDLAEITVSAACAAGTTWNGTICAPNSYTVTGAAGAGGTISPATQTVSHGSATTFTLSPSLRMLGMRLLFRSEALVPPGRL